MRWLIAKLICYFQWHVPPDEKSPWADDYVCRRCGFHHVFTGTLQEKAQILANEHGAEVRIVSNGERITAHPMGKEKKQ